MPGVSGKYRRAPRSPTRRAAFIGGRSDDEFDVIDAVAAVADEFETTSAAVALAWLLARSQTVVPIVGARRLEHLEANLAGLDVNLTSEHLRVLDEVSKPRLSYPAEMNGETRAMLQFASTTVDGETSTVYPPLLASDARY
jgi:aryl-alcohol dehydrogenase (NADP+)